jgi:hypothetical protein
MLRTFVYTMVAIASSSGCFGGVKNQYDPNAPRPVAYQQPDGSLGSSQPDYSSLVKMNTIMVTNASAIQLCGVALFDQEGHESPIETQHPIPPGTTGDVVLPAGLNYQRQEDKEKVLHAVYTLRAYTCGESGRRGQLFNEVANIKYWDGNKKEYAKPVIH